MSTTTTEIVEKIEQATVVSGFAKRNANKERIEQEEKELEELKAQNVEEPDELDEPAYGVEDKTFKKRYGDLRRHSQKKETELQNQLDELKRQLSASTKKEIKYPKSEDELETWMRQYPDVAQIVETIAMKKMHEQSTEYESKFKEIDAMKQTALKERAVAELLNLHPDFIEIKESDDFEEWTEQQPTLIQDALWHNETDALSAARAIDLYKADRGISKKKSSSKKDAAKSIGAISGNSSPSNSGKEGYLRESEVDKWSIDEYENRKDEIAEAINKDKFIYDLRGGAR